MEPSEKHINRIIIVGNGFDLACGLKSGYGDFLHWYLTKQVDFISSNPYKTINDGILELRRRRNDIEGIISSPNWFENTAVFSSDQLYKEITQEMEFKPANNFIKEVFEHLNQYKWVDIENSYFKEIKRIYKRSEKLAENRDFSSFRTGLEEVNLSLRTLSDQLNLYLEEQVKGYSYTRSEQMKEMMWKLYAPNRDKAEIKFLIVNFNYTSLFEEYSRVCTPGMKSQERDFINIHGTINNQENPIIFGYGDDTGAIYQEMEENGEPELRKYIKSFYYPRTNNYHEILNYLESGEFDVHIVGHSCGMSDKTLLSTIFEHKHCKKIKTYNYKEPKEAAWEEDFSRRLEISRHFKDKILMRERMEPFDEGAHIPQLKETHA